jgi:predicted nucleotidyltransferase/DNA-binding HxlR family transcriptional regulator
LYKYHHPITHLSPQPHPRVHPQEYAHTETPKQDVTLSDTFTTTTVKYFDTDVQYMIHLYQKVTQLIILSHFFENPNEEFYLRELARLLKISPMTIKRALDDLVGNKLIIRQKKKNQILYHANTESRAFKFAKISYNLAWLEENEIIEYLLKKVPGISSLILYGSYAKGENDKHSDLDLLMICTTKKIDSNEIEKRLKIEVNVISFTSTQWTKQAKTNRAFYLDIITEGIVLYGTRPVIE